ncbi:MAG: acetate--CoA ligase family protein, partial [Dehalococcoidia bacterium]|nr:acetate--CoA ligase family protein [Dehalococcoidia bacterium]
MKLHEYQAKELLARFGVPVPKGRVANTPEEAEAIARELGGKVVIKAQAHPGARGKAGGVKVAATPEEAKAHAAAIIGMTLVTHQTGPLGLPVHSVLVEEAIDIEREIYLSAAIDNSPGMPVLIASAQGGMDIE